VIVWGHGPKKYTASHVGIHTRLVQDLPKKGHKKDKKLPRVGKHDDEFVGGSVGGIYDCREFLVVVVCVG